MHLCSCKPTIYPSFSFTLGNVLSSILCSLVDCDSTCILNDNPIVFQGIRILWRDRKGDTYRPIHINAPGRLPISSGWPGSDSYRLFRFVSSLMSYISWHLSISQNLIIMFSQFLMKLQSSQPPLSSLNVPSSFPPRPLPCHSFWWAIPAVLPITGSFSPFVK